MKIDGVLLGEYPKTDIINMERIPPSSNNDLVLPFNNAQAIYIDEDSENLLDTKKYQLTCLKVKFAIRIE